MLLQGFWRKRPWAPSSLVAASATPATANGFSNSAACSELHLKFNGGICALILSLIAINFFYFSLHAFYGILPSVLRRTTSMQRLKHIGRFAALPERDYRGSEWASSAQFSSPLLSRQHF